MLAVTVYPAIRWLMSTAPASCGPPACACRRLHVQHDATTTLGLTECKVTLSAGAQGKRGWGRHASLASACHRIGPRNASHFDWFWCDWEPRLRLRYTSSCPRVSPGLSQYNDPVFPSFSGTRVVLVQGGGGDTEIRQESRHSRRPYDVLWCVAAGRRTRNRMCSNRMGEFHEGAALPAAPFWTPLFFSDC